MIMRYTNLTLFVIVWTCAVFSQTTTMSDKFPFGQPLLMDSLHNQNNLYDFGSNTAALLDDEQRFYLKTGGIIFYSSGQFRKAFDPRSETRQNYAATLVKPISVNDIFKGSFGYQRDVEEELKWMHQNRLPDINPFLLADSSTGQFKGNGLFFNSEWAHRFPKNYSFGSSLKYYVDQRLKQVFPKPEDQHRDVELKFSARKKWQHSRIGISYRYINEQEQISITKYNLEQNKTPELYKFRFTDLPYILSGKTSEQREIDYSGHFYSGQIYQNIFSKGILMVNGEFGNSSGLVADGGSYREEQGEFETEQFRFNSRLNYQITAKLKIASVYRYAHTENRAKHPEFPIEVFKSEMGNHYGLLSFSYQPDSHSKFFIDAGYDRFKRQILDRATTNFSDTEIGSYLFSFGMQFKSGSRLESGAWIFSKKYHTVKNHYTENKYSRFYDFMFLDPIDYYSNIDNERGLGFCGVYHYGPIYDLELKSQYSHLKSKSEWKGTKNRRNWWLMLSIKFFIIK